MSKTDCNDGEMHMERVEGMRRSAKVSDEPSIMQMDKIWRIVDCLQNKCTYFHILATDSQSSFISQGFSLSWHAVGDAWNPWKSA